MAAAIVRGAHARGKGSQRAIGAGVAVGSDDQVTGKDQPLLREQGVFDPHLSHFEVMDQALLPGEFAQELALLGRFDVLVGDEVIRDEDDFGRVEDLGGPAAAEFLDADGRGDVVAQNEVHAGR